jgi:hypothetical protein
MRQLIPEGKKRTKNCRNFKYDDVSEASELSSTYWGNKRFTDEELGRNAGVRYHYIFRCFCEHFYMLEGDNYNNNNNNNNNNNFLATDSERKGQATYE